MTSSEPSGRTVFLAGCGATARLALTVETLCREGLIEEDLSERLVGFMAGGDAALIRSLEGFEDREDYARQQVEELGFRDGDLMVGITEGGETPFVIASVEAALDLGSGAAWFCFCNPPEVLKGVVERSEADLENARVRQLPLLTGPMALSGSTRLQATTVQLAAMLLAFQNHAFPERIPKELDRLIAVCQALDYQLMVPFTEREFDAVQSGNNVIFMTQSFGLIVLTDTTERSPTFSMTPFENVQNSEDAPSLCYLRLPSAADAAVAWESILDADHAPSNGQR